MCCMYQIKKAQMCTIFYLYTSLCNPRMQATAAASSGCVIETIYVESGQH